MILTIDFETRSACDLRDSGVYAYAEHPSTEILCVAYKADDQPTKLFKLGGVDTWNEVDGSLEDFLALIAKAEQVCAHNASFERTLWRGVMVNRRGYPDIPLKKWRCSMALAAAFALPLGLEAVASVLGLKHQKDMAGSAIMKKFCQPTRTGEWYEKTKKFTPQDFVTMYNYCKQDVDAERELINRLPALSPHEQAVWQLDQEINDRGIYVPLKDVQQILVKVEKKRAQLDEEVRILTDGKIASARQLGETRAWLAQQGTQLDDLRKATVIETLKDETIDPKAKRLLEIRQSAGLTSIDKLFAMQRACCADSRIHGAFMYHAATTGRWGGRLIQPQNFPRDCFKSLEEVNFVVNAPIEEIDKKYGCTLVAASRCLRSMLRPAPGNLYVGGDYSSIEARVTAWLAGEEWVLQAFREGKDLYKVSASAIYGTPYEEITKPQRQLGKVCELALGFGGWTGAFDAMAGVYGIELEEEKKKEVIMTWRKAHPAIVRMWKGLEDAAKLAVKTKTPYQYGRVKFGMRGDFLHCRLPSGRLLSYYKPHFTTRTTAYGSSEVIAFYAVDSYTKKWSQQTTYGGSLTENCVQALARDILADALLRLDIFGYPICLHIHDECRGEHPAPDVKEFHRLMTTLPPWAAGIPLGAECETSPMYTKD